MTLNENFLGSEELSQVEIEEYEKISDETAKALEKAANISQEARTFLNTKLGQEIRMYIIKTKQHFLTLCATTENDKLADAQFEYKLICRLEQLFAQIISDGDDAIRNLEQMRAH